MEKRTFHLKAWYDENDVPHTPDFDSIGVSMGDEQDQLWEEFLDLKSQIVKKESWGEVLSKGPKEVGRLSDGTYYYHQGEEDFSGVEKETDIEDNTYSLMGYAVEEYDLFNDFEEFQRYIEDYRDELEQENLDLDEVMDYIR